MVLKILCMLYLLICGLFFIIGKQIYLVLRNEIKENCLKGYYSHQMNILIDRWEKKYFFFSVCEIILKQIIVFQTINVDVGECFCALMYKIIYVCAL